jgi:hypothetical protein
MSVWKDYVTAALLGVDKAAPPALPGPLEETLRELGAIDREVQFLTRAGALALWRKTGWKPIQGGVDIRAAEAETTALLSKASSGHLRTMLSGRCVGVFSEWLGAVARVERRVPPELLPALLDRARQDRTLRPLVMAAGGARAQWLATHRAEWAFAAVDSPELWETGSRDQRVTILRALREAAPAEARAKVEAVWKEEPADVRNAFLGAFLTNLLDEDVPFLEAVLDDRSKEVRRTAIDLLARLPSSPFANRMLARTTPLFAFKRGGLLSRALLEVTLPPEPDAAAARDGLDAKAFGQQKLLGEKAVQLVLMLSAVPLRHWTATFQQEPEALVKAAEKNEFGRALATGWAWAALRQRDAVWAEALLDGPVPPHDELLPGEPLLAVLPEPKRAERLGVALNEGYLKKGDTAAWQSMADQLGSFSDAYPPQLAHAVLAALRHASEDGIPWHLRGLAESLLLRIPVALLAGAAAGWPMEKEGIAGIVELLTFRHDALNALNQD